MCTPTSNCIYYHDAAKTVGKAAAVLTMITAIAIGVIVIVNQGWPGGALPQMTSLSVVASASFVTFLVCCYIAHRALSKAELDRARQEAADSVQVGKTYVRKRGGEEVDENQAIIADPGGFIKTNIIDETKISAINVGTAVVKRCHEHTGGMDILDAQRTFIAGHAFFGHMFSDPKIFSLIALKYVAGGVKGPETAARRLAAAYNSGDMDTYERVLLEYEAIMRGYNLEPICTLVHQRAASVTDVLKGLPEVLVKMFALPDRDLRGTVARMLNDIIFEDPSRTHRNRVVKASIVQNGQIGLLIQKLRIQLNAYKGTNNAEEKIKERQKAMTALKNLVVACLTASDVSDDQVREWNDDLVGQILPQCKETVKTGLSQCAVTIRLLVKMFDKKQSKDVLFPTINKTRIEAESKDCIKKDLQEELMKLQSNLNHSRPQTNRYILIATKEGSPMAQKHGELTQKLHSGNAPTRLTDNRVRALETKYGVQIEAFPAVILNPALVELRRMEESKKGRLGKWLGGMASNGMISWFAGKLGGLALGPLLDLMPPLNDTPGSAPELEGVAVIQNQSEREFFTKEIFEKVLKHFAPVVFRGAMSDGPFNAVFEKIIRTVGLDFADALEGLVTDPDMKLLGVRDVLCAYLDSLAAAFDPTLIQQQE